MSHAFQMGDWEPEKDATVDGQHDLLLDRTNEDSITSVSTSALAWERSRRWRHDVTSDPSP